MSSTSSMPISFKVKHIKGSSILIRLYKVLNVFFMTVLFVVTNFLSCALSFNFLYSSSIDEASSQDKTSFTLYHSLSGWLVWSVSGRNLNSYLKSSPVLGKRFKKSTRFGYASGLSNRLRGVLYVYVPFRAMFNDVNRC